MSLKILESMKLNATISDPDTRACASLCLLTHNHLAFDSWISAEPMLFSRTISSMYDSRILPDCTCRMDTISNERMVQGPPEGAQRLLMLKFVHKWW
jgi:hypothetical protein